MSLIMKTMVVLWHHRLVLMLILVAASLLAISAGRQMYRQAALEQVSGLQLQLNDELTAYDAADTVPALLDALSSEDMQRVHVLMNGGGPTGLSAPLCQRARTRSVVGPQPKALTCSVQSVQAKRSDIVCESIFRPRGTSENGRDAQSERACLVAIWSSNHRKWNLKSAGVGHLTDDPLFHEPSDLDEAAYPKLSER